MASAAVLTPMIGSCAGAVVDFRCGLTGFVPVGVEADGLAAALVLQCSPTEVFRLLAALASDERHKLMCEGIERPLRLEGPTCPRCVTLQ